MDNKEKLIKMYAGKEKKKKSIEELCNSIENEFSGEPFDFNLISPISRKIMIENIKICIQCHMLNVDVDVDSLEFIAYSIPKTGKGAQYYNYNFVSANIEKHKDEIYVILVKGLDYYLSCNCPKLFLDIAIERGISEEDKRNKTDFYFEYLSRIEALENKWY